MNARGEAQQGLEGRHRCAAPVEAEGELVQVGLEVVVADAVVGADQPTLEVPEHAMDARQDFPDPVGRALRAGPMNDRNLLFRLAAENSKLSPAALRRRALETIRSTAEGTD